MKHKDLRIRLAASFGALLSLASLSSCALTESSSRNLIGDFDKEFSLCVPWTREGYLVCDFNYFVTNSGSEPENILAANLFLRADGKTYQAKPEDQWQGGTHWISQTINPGERVMFRTSFSLPIGAQIEKIWVATPNQTLVTIPIGLGTDGLD